MRLWQVHLIGVACLLAAMAMHSRPMNGAPDPTPAAAGTEAAETHFRNSVAFIRGHIGDSGPYWFLIDTGASRSALDLSVARSLALENGSPTRVEGSAGTIDAETVRLPELRLAGNVVARAIEPTVYDLSGSLAPEGATIAGIIGYDLLKDFALTIEPRTGFVALASNPEPFLREGGQVVPFTLDNNIPRVRATIDGMGLDLRLDTGASIGPGPTLFVNVTQAFFDRLRSADPSLQPYTHFTASGTGGEIRLPVVRGRTLRLGGLHLGEPHVIVQPPVGYFGRPEAVGFLGSYSLQGLSRFIVDYPRRRLILYP